MCDDPGRRGVSTFIGAGECGEPGERFLFQICPEAFGRCMRFCDAQDGFVENEVASRCWDLCLPPLALLTRTNKIGCNHTHDGYKHSTRLQAFFGKSIKQGICTLQVEQNTGMYVDSVRGGQSNKQIRQQSTTNHISVWMQYHVMRHIITQIAQAARGTSVCHAAQISAARPDTTQ